MQTGGRGIKGAIQVPVSGSNTADETDTISLYLKSARSFEPTQYLRPLQVRELPAFGSMREGVILVARFEALLNARFGCVARSLGADRHATVVGVRRVPSSLRP
jgi:hypothetical protein